MDRPLQNEPIDDSINMTFRIGVALSAAPIAEHPHRTCRPLRGMLPPVPTEARRIGWRS